ncbi:heme peroxidase family protein [Kocuria sp. CPCC 205300]|uniref:peroxidase family protein n=1 Tax=Kocuria sabuli TaxID=3071448 RepID=UPI0036D9F58C
MGHGNADIDKITPQSTFYDSGRFGRLFPTLPPFSADTPLIRDALHELGAPRGAMDAQDVLSDPVALLDQPDLSADNPDNPDLTAGMTFLGQFLDHDMTFDPTSSLARQQDPESLRNFRIPALDLDSVYGGGPDVSPHLYDQSPERGRGRTTLLREEIPGSGDVSCGGTVRYDLPRNSQKVALIGDPRNDENLIVSQLHLAMISFHNAVVEDVEEELGPAYTPEEIFTEAQRIVRWHYHWMILHEYLPQTIGPDLADDILQDGRRFYHWRNHPFIPVEFSVAAFRFGHSQIRPSYRANFGPDANDLAQHFIGLIFDPDDPAPDDPGDLRGGCRAAKRFIDWQTFFDFSDERVRNNKMIDTKLSSVLFDLMGMPSGTSRSLAQRNLLRGLAMKLPSGQKVAAAMQAPSLAKADLAELQPLHLHKRTPLWYYVLKEAEVVAGGTHLGPVGGRIVGEVIHGLIEGASQSYLTLDPEWTPSYGADDDFRMVDLLKKAGVVVDLHQ